MGNPSVKTQVGVLSPLLLRPEEGGGEIPLQFHFPYLPPSHPPQAQSSLVSEGKL